MIICDEPRIAYYPPSKTGTTTVEKTLADLGIPIKVGRALKHDLPAETAAQDLYEDNYFFMITLRNPYSRAVSMWSHFTKPLPTGKNIINIESDLSKDSRGKDFKHWVDTVLLSEKMSMRYQSFFRSQAEYLAAMPRVDAVLFQESLTRNLLALPWVKERIGDWKVRHEQLGPYRVRSNWKDVYENDTGLIEAVKSRFEADFQAAQYSPEFEDAT